MSSLPFPRLESNIPFLRDCLLRFAVHGFAVLNMRTSAREKGKAADQRHVFLGSTDVCRAVSYRADPNWLGLNALDILGSSEGKVLS